VTPRYPPSWKICTPETAFEGGVIPVIPDTKEQPNACENCLCVSPGSMFGFLVDANGIGTKYFRFGKEGRIFLGRLIKAPCPVCNRFDDGGAGERNFQDAPDAEKFPDRNPEPYTDV
jgi:hypothetical protein